ncbi:MAG: hypothetical protein JNN01_12695 [Opitutaceae bacterium]|nr:hypothetical protein [Opitutaceae bacterium]
MTRLSLAAAGLLFGCINSFALTISDFHVDRTIDSYRGYFSATVTWQPLDSGLSAGAAISSMQLFEANGGLAFLDLYWEGDTGLRFETAPTDTNGDYSANAIDIFTLPISRLDPFPANLTSIVIPSRFWTGYQLSALPENAYGFRITAGTASNGLSLGQEEETLSYRVSQATVTEVPDGGVAIELVLGFIALFALQRRQRRRS